MTTITIHLLKHPAVLFASGFGSGLSPVAPGTIGTLASLLLFVLVQDTTVPLLLICLAGFIIGIWFCDFTSKKLGVHDHGSIVWDEFIGMWITMLWIPFSLLNIAMGFVLFRFFDIIKLWPISTLDKRVSGGFGIMIDDVLAGVFANICLSLIIWYF